MSRRATLLTICVDLHLPCHSSRQRQPRMQQQTGRTEGVTGVAVSVWQQCLMHDRRWPDVGLQATVYMEPQPVVALNNAEAMLADQVAEEELRILAALSQQVRGRGTASPLTACAHLHPATALRRTCCELLSSRSSQRGGDAQVVRAEVRVTQ